MRKIGLLILLLVLIGNFLSFRIEVVRAQGDCGRSPMQKLAVGDQARVANSPANDPLHTRPSAGLHGGYTGELVNGDIVTITDGPVCLNDYRFWEISGVGQSGWVRDGRDGQLWLELVGSSSTGSADDGWPSTQNQTADYQRYRLNDDEELQLKSQDDGKGRTLATIKGGGIVTVLELIDSNGMVIAKVRYGSLVGWVLFQIERESLFQPVD